MVEAITGLPPVLQVLIATGFTWGMTALGAGLVFFTKEVKRWVLDAMLGFVAGVMIAVIVIAHLVFNLRVCLDCGTQWRG